MVWVAAVTIAVVLVSPVFDISPVVFSAVSEADSMVKVAEWQQTYYASDSGIQSGATTVRDDESSTEYSGSKKYGGSKTTSTTTAPTAASAGGGGDTAASGLESPSGETFHQKSFSLYCFMCQFFPLCFSWLVLGLAEPDPELATICLDSGGERRDGCEWGRV